MVGYEVSIRAGIALHERDPAYHASGAWGGRRRRRGERPPARPRSERDDLRARSGRVPRADRSDDAVVRRAEDDQGRMRVGRVARGRVGAAGGARLHQRPGRVRRCSRTARRSRRPLATAGALHQGLSVLSLVAGRDRRGAAGDGWAGTRARRGPARLGADVRRRRRARQGHSGDHRGGSVQPAVATGRRRWRAAGSASTRCSDRSPIPPCARSSSASRSRSIPG